ncbi:MAG: hypothetical protein ABSG64_09355 [Solirubrobacteraceae bacterium]|jgi:hypothetical protein
MSSNPKRLRYALPGAVLALALFSATAFAAVKPTATTGAASSITYQSAIVAATVNPEGQATAVYFQYGTTTAYGAVSTSTELGAVTKNVAVTATISGLVANTTYDYRVVAINATGQTNGLNRTFKTAKIPLSLLIVAAPSPVNYNDSLTIEGTLAGTNNANAAVELQQTVYPYTAAFAAVGNSELTDSTGGFTFDVLTATANTEYRVVSVKDPTVMSPVVSEPVAVVATISSKGIGSKAHPESRFSGTVSPGLEVGARIEVQELTSGTNWADIGGTVTAATTNSSGVATYKVKLHFHHGGFFRVLAEPIEGAHISGYSPTILAKGH